MFKKSSDTPATPTVPTITCDPGNWSENDGRTSEYAELAATIHAALDRLVTDFYQTRFTAQFAQHPDRAASSGELEIPTPSVRVSLKREESQSWEADESQRRLFDTHTLIISFEGTDKLYERARGMCDLLGEQLYAKSTSSFMGNLTFSEPGATPLTSVARYLRTNPPRIEVRGPSLAGIVGVVNHLLEVGALEINHTYSLPDLAEKLGHPEYRRSMEPITPKADATPDQIDPTRFRLLLGLTAEEKALADAVAPPSPLVDPQKATRSPKMALPRTITPG